MKASKLTILTFRFKKIDIRHCFEPLIMEPTKFLDECEIWTREIKGNKECEEIELTPERPVRTAYSLLTERPSLVVY